MESKKAECIFCKIASGEIPAKIIHRDEKVVVFLDIMPCSLGHTLVIPKNHYPNLNDMPRREVEYLFGVAHKMALLIQKALNADGYNMGLNNGSAAGQVIGHVHIHIIPRYKNDGGGSMHSIIKQEIKEDLDNTLKKIRECI